jgi:hypothetical protein
MKFKIMSAFSNEGLIASLRGDPANPDESIPIYRPRGSSNASAGNAMATSTPAREPSPARSPSPGRGPRTEEQKEEMRRRRELRVQEAIRETEEEVRQLEEQREQQKRGRRMRINRLSQITARSVTQNQLTAGVSTSKGYFDMFYNLLPVSVKAGITRAMGIVVPAIQSVLPSTRYVAFGGSKRRSQKGGDRQAIFDEVERSEELTLPITFLRFIGIPEEAIEGFKQNGYIAIGPDNINVLNYYILRHIFANDIYKITREKFSELLSKLKAKSQKDMRRYEENTPAVIQYDFNIIDGTFDDTIRALRNNDRGVLKRITAQKSTRQAKTNLLKGSMLNITRRLNKLRARRSLQPTVKYGIPPTIIEEDEGQEITVGTPPRAYVPEVYRYGGRRSRKRQQKKKKTRRRN